MTREAKETITLAALFVAVLIAMYCTGCGGAVQVSARASLVTAGTLVTAGGVVDDARDEALDAVEEAHPQVGPERSAALEAEAAHWRPVGQALDEAREVLGLWNAANDAALAAQSDDSTVWRSIVPFLQRLLRVYGRAVELAQSLGKSLPHLPEEIGAILNLAAELDQ